MEVVDDTREGWVKSLETILRAHLEQDQLLPKFDYSKIRPPGLPLKSFGGTSSGPQPLIDLHNLLYEMLDKREG